MLYRIKLTIGFRDAYIDFYDSEEAANFATSLMEHYVQPENEEKTNKSKYTGYRS